MKIDNATKSGTLGLSAELTIQHSSELKKALLDSLEQFNHLRVNLEKVTEIDLSSIQLLYSAYVTALESGKQFSLQGKCPEKVSQAFAAVGFSDFAWNECREEIY